jgi:hypothetical protein
MTTTRMEMLVQARNQASGVFREVRGDLDQLNTAAALVGGGLIGIAAAGGIDAIVNMGQAVFDLGREAQGLEALKSAFDDLAGSIGASSDALMNSLKGVSQGMIADQDLILAANRAIILGVTDSTQEMEQLMQVAITRGRAMGLSATQAFNDLVTGLGRMSPLILDNLGIVTGGEKVFDAYAKSLGKTTEQLSDAEKKQALFNKVMAESRDIMAGGIQGNPFAQMDAQMANLRVNAGKMMAPLAGDIAGSLADGLRGLNGVIEAAFAKTEYDFAQKFGYGVGLLLAEGIKAGLGAGGPIEFRTLFGEDFYKSAQEAGAATRQAILDEMPAIKNAVGDALGSTDTLTERAETLRRIGELQAEIAVQYNAILEDANRAIQLQAAGNGDLTPAIHNDMQQRTGVLRELRAEYDRLAATLGKVQGPLSETEAKARAAGTAWQTFAGGARAAGGAATGTVGPMQAAASAGFSLDAALKAISGSAGVVPGALAAAGAAVDSIRGKMVQAALAGMEMAQALAIAQRYQGLEKQGQQIAQGLGNLGFYEPQDIAFYVDVNTQKALQEVDALAAEAMRVKTTLTDINVGVPLGGDEAAKRGARTQGEYLAALEATNEETRAGERAAVKFGDSVAGSSSYAKKATDDLREGFGQLGAGIEDAIGGGGGGGGGATGAIDGLGVSLDNLRGKVEGILGNALSVDVGVNPADFLPREDAVNEDARRLADVMVKGFESPWYEFLSQKFPGMFDGAGDIKEKAAAIMRDFQSGLRPELIDKEAVKEQVKRMLLGDANMAALADEIAQELAAEMGVSLERAKQSVGAVMGLSGGDATGAGTGLAEGFADATNGEKMVGDLVVRMEAAYVKLQTSGAKAGEMWGTGFMSVVETGVSVPLIHLLAVLVTPAVLAEIQRQASQTTPP